MMSFFQKAQLLRLCSCRSPLAHTNTALTNVVINMQISRALTTRLVGYIENDWLTVDQLRPLIKTASHHLFIINFKM